MATVINSIQFKRGEKAVLEAKLVGNDKPKKGEPVWELDTNKLKLGDGLHNYGDLEYLGSTEEAIIIEGYKHPTYDTFFKEQSYNNPLPRRISKLYKDIPSGLLYYLSNDIYTLTYQIADAERYGLVKLYGTSGQNTDGSMTQKAITDGISGVKFAVAADEGENYLDLQKPW